MLALRSRGWVSVFGDVKERGSILQEHTLSPTTAVFCGSATAGMLTLAIGIIFDSEWVSWSFAKVSVGP